MEKIALVDSGASSSISPGQAFLHPFVSADQVPGALSFEIATRLDKGGDFSPPKKRLGSGANGQVVLVIHPQGGMCAVKLAEVSRGMLKNWIVAQEEHLRKVEQMISSCKEEEDAQCYRIKKLAMERDLSPFKASLERMDREVAVLAQVGRVQGVVHLLGVVPDGSRTLPAGAPVLEYIEGPTLLEHVTSKRYAPSDTFSLGREIVEQVRALHAMRVAHRDLKLENFLLDQKGQVRLTDFGESCMVPLGKETIPGSSLEDGLVGTPHYLSPEIVAQTGEIDPFAADMWALGCVLFAIETQGKRPFDMEDRASPMTYIQRVVDTKPQLNEIHDSLLKDLLTQLFSKEPAKRPTAEAVLRHPYFTSGRLFSAGSSDGAALA